MKDNNDNQTGERKMKELVIGEDYGFVFGYTGTRQAIYRGDDQWEAIEDGEVKGCVTAPKMTAGALAYINRPSVHTSASL